MTTRSNASAQDAYTAARRTWLEGRRLDMTALAEELGVSRPTLYAWCGGRQQLLIDVMWDVTQDVLAEAWDARPAGAEGPQRTLSAVRAYVHHITEAPWLRAFLRNEKHTALRLLTTRGGYQDRLVQALAELLSAEDAAGHLHLRARSEVVAYAIVRVIEGFLYDDAVGEFERDIEPGIAKAVEVVRLLIT